MRIKHKVTLAAAAVLGFLGLAVWYFRRHPITVLSPSGDIGYRERNLIYFSLALALLVVIPVYTMAIVIAYKYRAGNTQAEYRPDWDGNRLIEGTWWAIPGVIILILSIVTWNSSHTLDPFRPIASSQKPLDIQVVSLDWKWLFIYPQQGIASVNYAQFPVGVPLNFEITSDTVMNSFWIPALGSQIYSMPGMSTQVHLISDKMGSFHGSSANISGVGFASMDFTAKATSAADFSHWVSRQQSSASQLSLANYDKLSKPSLNNPPAVYSHVKSGLYDDIVLKYFPPSVREAAALNGAAVIHGGHY